MRQGNRSPIERARPESNGPDTGEQEISRGCCEIRGGVCVGGVRFLRTDATQTRRERPLL